MSSTYIIAEIGCNHNGDPKLARKMVSTAQECGVDAVKFQTFSADALISRYAPKAEYQIVTTGDSDSQLEMTKALDWGTRICSSLFHLRVPWASTHFLLPSI